MSNRPVPDFYSIFGLTKGASEREIRSAYRRLAMLYHPDKVSPLATPETRLQQEERFKHLHAVYEVLIDPTKRSAYDQYGVEALIHPDDRAPPASSPSSSSSSSSRSSSRSSFSSSSSSSSSSASSSPSMSGFASPRSTSGGRWASPASPQHHHSHHSHHQHHQQQQSPSSPSSSSSYGYGRNAAAASSQRRDDAETTHTFHFSFGSTDPTSAAPMPTPSSSSSSSQQPSANTGFTLPCLDLRSHAPSPGTAYGDAFGNESTGGTFTNYTNLPSGHASHMHMHLPQLTPQVAEKMLSSMLAAMGATALPDLPANASQQYGLEALVYPANNNGHRAGSDDDGNTAMDSGNDGMDERDDTLPLGNTNGHSHDITTMDNKGWPAATASSAAAAAAAQWHQSMMNGTSGSMPSMGHPSMSSMPGGGRPAAGPANVFNLELSLEDLFMGGTKRMRIQRLRWDAHGVLRPEIKMLEIKIMPGWRGGTKITYEREGDEHDHRAVMPSDIVFVVVETRHPRFSRRGDHLCYTHDVSERDVTVAGGPVFNIPTLDGRTLTIDCRNGPPVRSGSKHKIVGEGMPTKLLAAPPSSAMVVSRPQRGDLLIDFNVMFPADPLSHEQKRSFMTSFPSSSGPSSSSSSSSTSAR